LKYYRGVLYFTIAFEAEAHFVDSGGLSVYRFEQVGPLPTSGGDTYNAVEAVDDEIYFGGWVHAPAVYRGRAGGLQATISFVNKYSHVHAYSVSERRVKLLWKESLHHETDWVGEISEIVYDPVNDRLLLARSDGMQNLGIYQMDRRGGSYAKLSDRRALKGAPFYDHICFDIMDNWAAGANGIQCIDLVENKVRYLEFGDPSKRSLDGGRVFYPITGVAAQAYGRFFLFIRGGVFVGNPIDESVERVTFVRLFDFVKSGYNPRRTMAKNFGGGILVAYNAYTEALVYPTNESEKLMAAATNTIAGPSVLLYIAPPTARIVAAMGARITGIELVGDKILLAVSNMANTFRYDALPVDAGFRGLVALSQDVVNGSPPPVRFTVRGWQVETEVFGGIPLAGYREPRLVVTSKKSNKVYIYEYDFSLPPLEPTVEAFSVGPGRSVVDLKPYRGSIVAFRFEEHPGESVVRIDLE